MLLRLFGCVLATMLLLQATAQTRADHLIQFSGQVLSQNQKEPIPYATVIILNTQRGTIANFDGFFSIAVMPDDTIRISAMGFKPVRIPIQLYADETSVFQNVFLAVDTLFLQEVRVYPWVSPLHLKQAFLQMDFEDDYYDIALRNLQQQAIHEFLQRSPIGASANQEMVIQQYWAQQYYSAGGQLKYTYWNVGGRAIPAPFLNLQFWQQLIRAFKEMRK